MGLVRFDYRASPSAGIASRRPRMLQRTRRRASRGDEPSTLCVTSSVTVTPARISKQARQYGALKPAPSV
ncbi:hypothetical protein MTO96_024442 [Rhipicephalus appendiculatus]